MSNTGVTALQVLLIPKYMLSHVNSTLFIIAKVVALLLLLANLAHQKMTEQKKE